MKYEHSAGGVVVRKVDSQWQVLVVRDMNDTRTFPKGNIEKGETPIAAARREIDEEVGLRYLKLLKKLSKVSYSYKRNGPIHKTVQYFLFKTTRNMKLRPQTKEGIHDARWIPLPEALDTIGYAKTNKPLLVWTYKVLLM